MIRRDFCKTSLALAGLALSASERLEAARSAPAEELAKAPGLTKYVSEFIVNTRYEDIPENVIALGKKTILDGFGLALAGSASTAGPVIRKYIESLGPCGGGSSIVGTKLKVHPRFAALANGISIHADDYDDTGSAFHVAAPVLPPSFALCEMGRRSGKDLMLAFHVGVEVGNKIGDAMSPRHQQEGFHTTGTIGSLGSVAACAKLRGLDADKTAIALAIAASEASGLRDNFGSMTKPFHAGHAGENGTVAADLAAIGWTAAPDILEAQLGFFAIGGGFDPKVIVGKLGKPWMFASPGDLIKRFPCGTIQQQVMDEMLRLIQQNDIKAADVEKVEVGGNLSNYRTLFQHHPTTGLQGKFSMEYAMAILLLERKATLSSFTDAVVQRPEVQDMIARVHYAVDPEFNKLELQGASLQAMLVEQSGLKIYLKSGKVISGVTKPAKGSPENPMTYEEVADKFRGNAEFAKWPAQKAAVVIDLVKSLETAPDVSRLTAALAS
ncbi:MAG TPA: MmgE/PrpD family protein [Bryobacteraceae bacterium]|nr:MmgE/PrpD family protein [Bryobacteraceae bacterium]